jgi:predicted DCC family thiol-disulfide oxidoreductase YuxK
MSGEVVFYDGGCGLCHGAVRLLLRLDRRGRLRFAPLGGETFEALVPASARAALPDSLMLRDSRGRLLARAAAVSGALAAAGGVARVAAAILSLVPQALADGAYDALARRRRRLFARPQDACPVPPGGLRDRFLP